MSSTSPISLRIASKTCYFKSSGDSSYYYSNQLITNLALLKTIAKLGPQLGWPIGPDKKTTTKIPSATLAKANRDFVGSRIKHIIDMKSGPGRIWIASNKKLVEKLSTSQQFFNSKAIGLLAKTLGRSNRFKCFNLPELWRKSSHQGDHHEISKLSHEFSHRELNAPIVTSFNSLLELARYTGSPYKVNKSKAHLTTKLTKYGVTLPIGDCVTRGLLRYETKMKKPTKQFPYPFMAAKQPANNESHWQREKAKCVFKTPDGLPFYLTSLAMIGHSQVLRSSLIVAPIVSGGLQSNLLIANHDKMIKISTGNGLNMADRCPKCYVGLSNKDMVINVFLKIPAKLADKANVVKQPKKLCIIPSKAPSRQIKLKTLLAKQNFVLASPNKDVVTHLKVFIVSDLHGASKLNSRTKLKNISIRWPCS